MKKTIICNGSAFEFTAVDMKREGAKVITHEQAKNILFKTQKLLKARDINVCLIFGTLLGAIREHDFISHDYDVDVYTSQEEDLIDSIPYLYENGLEICRAEDGRMYSFMSNGVYIDVYILKKAPFPFNLFCYSLTGGIMPKSFFKETEEIEFLGGRFLVPKNPEKLIEYHYGKTWRTPIKGKTGRNSIYPVYLYKKYLSRYITPLLLKLLKKNKLY